MTTFRSKFFALAIIAVLAGMGGYATSVFASSATAPSAERLALAKQYVASVPVESEVKAAVEQLATKVRPEQRVLFRTLADSTIDYQRLRTAAELATAESFTDAEIKAMIEFFGSPVGQSIRKKLPAYEAQIQPVLTEVLQKFVMKLQENNVTLDLSNGTPNLQ